MGAVKAIAQAKKAAMQSHTPYIVFQLEGSDEPSYMPSEWGRELLSTGEEGALDANVVGFALPNGSFNAHNA